MSQSLKVLMMGGRRAGKTSILAGLLDSMINGEVKEFLSVVDKTVLMPGQESLEEKITSLKQSIQSQKGKTFLVDDSKTMSFSKHVIEFAIPGTGNNMTIEFKDVNGEFWESKSSYDTGGGELINKAEIVEAVKEADIFVIAVDTPYLMEAANPYNDLCDESVNMAHNHVEDIHSYLSNLDDKEGADAKMVLFVPVKCEKWAHNGQIDKVVSRIKEVYAVIIKALSNYKNVEVDILPVQTAGSIEFKEHQQAYVCSNKDYVARKCCLLDDESVIRFSDGETRNISSSDIIDEDSDARISQFHNIIRPYSWFRVTGTGYAPHNCEQLAYYILQFVLSKYLFTKKIEEAKKKQERDGRKWWKYAIAAAIAYISIPVAAVYLIAKRLFDNLGTISLEQLQTTVDSLKSKGLIKYETEGITNIKKSLLNVLKNL